MKIKFLIIFLLTFFSMVINAQQPIKRKGATNIKPKVIQPSSSTITKKKPGSQQKTRKRRVNNTYYVTDSIAVDESDDNEIIEFQLSDDFTLIGRVKTDYVDEADAQKEMVEAIAKYDNAKTACLTNHKGVFVYGGNGYYSNQLSSDMMDALRYCNNNKYTINDIAVTDIGWWCVVYEGNKYKGSLPDNCKKALDGYIKDGEKILSLSISENGNYALITDKHYDASNEFDKKAMKIAGETFDYMKSVCITNNGIFVTCSKGALFWDVPENIIEKLKMYQGKPTLIRYTDSGTYIALDGKGLKLFYM